MITRAITTLSDRSPIVLHRMPSLAHRRRLLLDHVCQGAEIETRTLHFRLRAHGLIHREHVLQIDVVAWQFVTQVRDHVRRLSDLPAHNEAGQVARTLRLLGTMEQQRPRLVVGV